MTVKIRRNDDPFRKYWWAILAVFAVSGAWICAPLLEGGSYSGSVAQGAGGLGPASSSLDSAFNPNGAPGGVLDLSMEKPRASSGLSAGAAASSLYQAPEGGAPGAPIAEGSAAAGAETAAATLAAALKQVSEKKADPGGWGGQKPLKGFTPPKANFAPLSGLGGAGSSGGSSGARIGSFGTALPDTGVATARGLSGSVSEAPAADVGGRALGGLKSAAEGKKLAFLGEGDAAVADSRRFFDGGGQGGGAISGGGASDGGLGGAFGSLNAAPANLKANRTDLDHFEITPPPAKPVQGPDQAEEMKKQLLMVAVSMVVMGVAGPMAGMIVMQAIPMMTAAAQQKALQDKAAAELAAGRRI